MVGKNIREIEQVKMVASFENVDSILNQFEEIGKEKCIQKKNDEVTIKIVSTDERLSFDGSTEIELIVSFAIGVSSGVVANIVYNALCTGIKKLNIGGRRTRITEEEITQTIDEIRKGEESEIEK